MTRCLFTQELVDSLTPLENLFDMTAKGYPGFGLRTLPSGRKNWFYRYRIKDSVRMVILGQTSWMKLPQAFRLYGEARDQKWQGIDPKGQSTACATIAEADHLYYELFTMINGKRFPEQLKNDTPLAEFARYFHVQPAAVKKLDTYQQLAVFEEDGQTLVRVFIHTIEESYRAGLEIL
jgi:hypothetical protein